MISILSGPNILDPSSPPQYTHDAQKGVLINETPRTVLVDSRPPVPQYLESTLKNNRSFHHFSGLLPKESEFTDPWNPVIA